MEVGDTHLVVKRADILTYLDLGERTALRRLVAKVNEGRYKDGKPFNHYIVVNQDEPYAEAILQRIKDEEEEQSNG